MATSRRDHAPDLLACGRPGRCRPRPSLPAAAARARRAGGALLHARGAPHPRGALRPHPAARSRPGSARQLGAARYVETLLTRVRRGPAAPLHRRALQRPRRPTPSARGRRSDALPPNSLPPAPRADTPPGALLARRALRLRGRRPARGARRAARRPASPACATSTARGSPASTPSRTRARRRALRRPLRRGAGRPARAARRAGLHRRSRARAESFLDVVIRHVLEGCFSAPEYGGNRGGAGWRMIGIEGDSQPLGYSIYADARERLPRAPRSPDVDPEPRRAAPAERSRRGRSRRTALAIQETISDFAGLLEQRRARRVRLAADGPERQRDRRRRARQPRPRALRLLRDRQRRRRRQRGHVLAEAGRNVLVLEAGAQPVPGSRPARRAPAADCTRTTSSSTGVRELARAPGTARAAHLPHRPERRGRGCTSDVNALPKAVGGAFQHADCKTPRFNVVDFRLRSEVEALIAATPGLAVPGLRQPPPTARASPTGPSATPTSSPSTSRRSSSTACRGPTTTRSRRGAAAPYPMPPGVPMYLGCCSPTPRAGRRFAGAPLHPHTYPAAINSRPYAGRPACVDCGFCSGFGCPSHAKGSPAVTALRRALPDGALPAPLQRQVVRLDNDGGHVSAAVYQDGDGKTQSAVADRFLLAASAIESARLCLLSETPLGGSARQRQRPRRAPPDVPPPDGGERLRPAARPRPARTRREPRALGLPRRRAGRRGAPRLRRRRRAAPLPRRHRRVRRAPGPADHRGRHGLRVPAARRAARASVSRLKNARARRRAHPAPGRADHAGRGRAAAAQPRRPRPDACATCSGYPVARVTYRPHAFELETRRFYVPVMRQVLENAGAGASSRRPATRCSATRPTAAT